jgi:hypothetical protein
MNLKNYTSSVPASTSVDRIERRLVAIGAKNVNKEYKDGTLIGIKFLIDVNGNTIGFELPARIEVVFDVLYREYRKPTAETKKRVSEQAVRTAWKIISDWVEIQASMIYLEQAEILQVFLPYALMPNGKSVYTNVIDSGLKLLK